MSNNFIKRFFTSILLIILLLIVNFSYNFIFIITLFIINIAIYIEFNKIFKKIFKLTALKDKNYLKYLFSNFIIIFYIFIIFTYSAYDLHGDSGSQTLFLFIICVCFFGDIGGYVVGKNIGGKKLTKISPNKTYSGTIGSFIFSIFPIIIFNNFIDFNFLINIENIFIILSISLISQLGDILISYLKRKASIKDTGNLLPGHGGIIDRLDGIIFAIPYAYFILIII